MKRFYILEMLGFTFGSTQPTGFIKLTLIVEFTIKKNRKLNGFGFAKST